MYIFSYIKNNAVKSLAAASAIALLSLLLVSIIYSFKPSYPNSHTDLPNSTNQQKTNVANSASKDNPNSANLVNDSQVGLQFINPETPCPPQQLSCIAKQNDDIKDQSCPSYKPIWVYFSKDNGASWMQVGCYATQIDATKALNKAIASGVVKNNRILNSNNNAVKSDGVNNNPIVNPSDTNPAPPPASSNSIQDIFNNPFNKPAEPEKQNEKPVEKSQTFNATEPIHAEQKIDAKTEQQTHLVPISEVKESATANEPTGIASEKENREDKHQNLTVRFKLLFGLIPIEKRTYPNEEMREKALFLWKKEQKLLEPDGTVNERYAFRSHNNEAIIHH